MTASSHSPSSSKTSVGSSQSTKPLESRQGPSPTHNSDCFIVGVGASAGGLESLEKLFGNMPESTGMAFVVLQHLSPDFKSLMNELLARRTKIPVCRAEEGMLVEADHIYLLPPQKEMIITQGRLHLTDKEPKSGLALPIDHFFRSLAQDRGERAAGVILSGSGSDGSRGIVEIAKAGGLVIAESEATAKFEGMPSSAIQTGVVDFTLPPEEIPDCLRKFLGTSLDCRRAQAQAARDALEGIEAIFDLLRHEYGIDFSHYKPTTVSRRIARRLSMNCSWGLEQYIEILRTDPTELNLLYQDLLIGVTRFFRDPDFFARLEREVIPEIVQSKAENEDIRIWIAGCATGEEAYSVAILVHEALEQAGRPMQVKLFATDVHKASLEQGSHGIYDEERLKDVSDARLRRYFTKRREGYEISKDIRQMIVFAPHNVLTDAPFTSLDMVTCRNLLIYFQTQAQQKALSLFHFGLRTGGFLFLGSSETPGELSDEFTVIDDHCKIFRKRRDIRLPTDLRLSTSPRAPRKVGASISIASPLPNYPDATLLGAYDQLLDRFMPPSFLVSEERELLDCFGGAEKFLRLKARRPSADFLDLLHSNARTSIAGALQRAMKEQQPIRFSGISVATEDGEQRYKLAVEPVHNSRTNVCHYLITLTPLEPTETQPEAPGREEFLNAQELSRQQIGSLEEELRYTRENLQATIEELETSNEELQATNEELVASNEELQSTNEELHSVNEELYTVNAEHQKKITELNEVNQDMSHFLEASDVGALFLDRNLRIRKFTPAVGEVLDILAQDIGRKLSSFAHRLDYAELQDHLQTILTEGTPIEREVHDQTGRFWFLRLLPYRIEERVEGVVLTLTEMSVLIEERARSQHLSSIVESSSDAICSHDLNGIITSWNMAASHLLGYSPEQVIGQHISLLVRESKQHELSSLLAQVSTNEKLPWKPTEWQHKDGSQVAVSVTFSPLIDQRGKLHGISAIARDITGQRQKQQKTILEHMLSRILTTTETVEQFLKNSLVELCNRLEAGIGELWLPDSSGQALRLAAIHSQMNGQRAEAFREVADQTAYTKGSGLVGKAWEAREPVCSSTGEADQPRREHVALAMGMTSSIATPIADEKDCLGALLLYFPQFHSSDRYLLQLLADVGKRLGQMATYKRKDELIRESEARFRETYENAAVGIGLMDTQGRWLRVNQRLCEITGYQKTELERRTYQQILYLEDSRTSENDFEQLLTNNSECSREQKRCLRPDGALVWIKVTISLIRNGNGDADHFIAIVEDISEQKKAEDESINAVKRREQFLAMLSHELRNPLSAVRTAARMLNDQSLSPGQESHAKEVITRQTAHITRLLDDLLDVSRITQNKIELRKETVNLYGITEDALISVKSLAESHDVEIIFERKETDELWVHGDPARLQQVQINLLTNAIKYSPPGEQVILQLKQEEKSAVIYMKDNGVGIPPEMLDNIFELFVQSESSLARSGGGMGVGLTLVRMIVELHGGTVKAFSEGAGCGSEFVVHYPLAQSNNGPKQQPAVRGAPPVNNMSVVIVEDEQDNRDLLSMLLSFEGYTVYTGSNGERGFELIIEKQPEIAIIDIGLPVMNGYELARAVRAQLGKELYLIALTGYGQPQDVQKALDAGFDVHLVKPLDPEKLHELLAPRHAPPLSQG